MCLYTPFLSQLLRSGRTYQSDILALNDNDRINVTRRKCDSNAIQSRLVI